MKIGIVGLGRIANTVADILVKMPEIECYAVGSRDLEKSLAFARKFGFEKSYGSYKELYSDSKVDLVYVCTPHTVHYECIKDALIAGKNVLCEKPITVNSLQLKELMAIAKEKNLYLAEAMWIRYMPSVSEIRALLESGIIGKLKMFSGFLSYNITYKERIVKKEYAGGALWDLGVYGINTMLLYMGDEIESIESSVIFTESGVDKSESISVKYKDGRFAVLVHAVDTDGGREGIFHGENGHMVIDNINCPSCVDVYNNKGEKILHKDFPIKIDGFEYEFEEADFCIKNGLTESKSMPLSESLKTIEICEKIQALWKTQQA